MSLQQTLAVFELLDSAHIDGQQVVNLFAAYPDVDARFTRVSGPKGRTDFVRIDIPGRRANQAVAVHRRWGLLVALVALALVLAVSAWCQMRMARLRPLPARLNWRRCRAKATGSMATSSLPPISAGCANAAASAGRFHGLAD